MKRIGLLPNVEKDIGLVNTAMILDWLEKKNCTINLLEVPAQLLQRSDLAKNENQLYRDSDFIVVLGGDGTFLGAARNAALYDTPILGINLGTLGFLAEVEKRSSLEALQKVLNGEYSIEKRMMLEASVYDCHNDERKFICLNDIGITRGSLSRIIDLKIFINDNFVDDYPADGIIISTPTGSTGYNLSAGGPILDPNTNMMVITPICPHSLYARSIVVSDGDIIKVQIGENFGCDVILTIDGQMGYHLKSNDIVTIQKSKYQTSLIKTSNYSFFDILRKKIVGTRSERYESEASIENSRIDSKQFY
ncbi:NAD(+) kinase [Defluviitalea raffinosedens]|uniref:NAD kinase n=1 Tax=Defluviitalea raffinosedens TaxID=1450156 RepID=A0A7C8LEJ0_9FIRM|nr:NAD(+)/NADH kinase [Defluviitalea raffinosedens]KAE9637221.1 NAD(+) kinase [Defluviitalea raffinosedens]HHW66750.1 NAD(+)/NADH kinase [Candidatus Epulonipiscium sp.]